MGLSISQFGDSKRMKNPYKDILNLGIVLPSTTSTWKKKGKHPAWVDIIRQQAARISELEFEIEESQRTVTHLARIIVKQAE